MAPLHTPQFYSAASLIRTIRKRGKAQRDGRQPLSYRCRTYMATLENLVTMATGEQKKKQSEADYGLKQAGAVFTCADLGWPSFDQKQSI